MSGILGPSAGVFGVACFMNGVRPHAQISRHMGLAVRVQRHSRYQKQQPGVRTENRSCGAGRDIPPSQRLIKLHQAVRFGKVRLLSSAHS